MKGKEKVSLRNFEMLTDSTNGKLVGGFSAAGSSGSAKSGAAVKNDGCAVINNCNGGNCVQGCGSPQ